MNSDSSFQNHIKLTDTDRKSNHSENLLKEHDLWCGQGNTEDDKKSIDTTILEA